MVDEGRNCQELLQQLVAIRSAVQQTSVVVARSYAGECLSGAPKGARSQEALIDDLINTLAKTN
jgi:DNA-binding FrmR family transcriptional regulator